MFRLEPKRVLTDVTSPIRVVIPEPIVIQSSFRILVLTLILKWNERGWLFPLPPVDVQLLFPHLVALLVVGLHRCGEVAGSDGVAPAVSHGFGCKHKRFSFKQASGYELA